MLADKQKSALLKQSTKSQIKHKPQCAAGATGTRPSNSRANFSQ